MRNKRPSPALVISIIALVMATTGSAVAAVSYASRAGSVDGYSAVGASSTNSHAAGNLVATAKGGSFSGKIPNKFLAQVPAVSQFAVPFDVVDNQVGATQDLASTPLGKLQASCRDEATAPTTENPRTTVQFVNTSGGPENIARRVGVGDGAFSQAENGTVQTVDVSGSQTFFFHVQQNATQVIVQGVVRQDRPDPNTGKCLVFGVVQVVQ
jgi:hypothetical protein